MDALFAFEGSAEVVRMLLLRVPPEQELLFAFSFTARGIVEDNHLKKYLF
jgi:hypothetical protein